MNHFENGRRKALREIKNIRVPETENLDYMRRMGKQEGKQMAFFYSKDQKSDKYYMLNAAATAFIKLGYKGVKARKVFEDAFIAEAIK